MSFVMAFPIVAPLVGSLVAMMIHRRVGPAFAAVGLAVTAVALTGGVAMAAGFYGLSAVEPLEETGWCRALLGHDVHPHPLIGAAAGVVALFAVLRPVRWWARYRRTLRARPAIGDVPLIVLDSAEPIAYAHPAGSGSVVVSFGLMTQLTREQRLVVLAHERVHLDRHHSRLLVASELAAAGFPLAAPLSRAVRWCTERAADEATAALVGDRRLVAETIVKTAMASTPAGLAGMSGSAVVDRVEALMGPPLGRSWLRSATFAVAAAIALAGTANQAHHFAEVLIQIG